MKPSIPLKKDDYYLLLGRLIPYKRADLAIKACNRLKRRLIVVGEGRESERRKLVKIAGPTIEFKTGVSDEEAIHYFQHAKAFIYPQAEDFGVTLVESLAAGTPVIAYKKDGALDSMINGVTGLLFEDQTVSSLSKAIERFETMTFSSQKLQQHAAQFSEERFIKEIREFVRTTRQRLSRRINREFAEVIRSYVSSPALKSRKRAIKSW